MERVDWNVKKMSQKVITKQPVKNFVGSAQSKQNYHGMVRNFHLRKW